MEIALKDQLGRTLKISKTPKRIVSLVPSQTELLVALGLEDQLVGITKFCIHPSHLIKTKTIVGGTKTVYAHKIAALQPDIILCNKEENTKEIVASLEKQYTVHVSDVVHLEDSIALTEQYGQLFQCKKKAQKINKLIKKEANAFAQFIKDKPKRKALYFIWKNPWMSVGQDTFIHHMLSLNGFTNVMGKHTRYPELSAKEVKNTTTDLILLSSEPFPFKEKHLHEMKNLNPNAKILLVDGEYFSWYGSRLIDAFHYFRSLH